LSRERKLNLVGKGQDEQTVFLEIQKRQLSKTTWNFNLKICE